jgi:hypothetical protein
MQHVATLDPTRFSMTVAFFPDVGPDFIQIAFPSNFAAEIFNIQMTLLRNHQF